MHILGPDDLALALAELSMLSLNFCWHICGTGTCIGRAVGMLIVPLVGTFVVLGVGFWFGTCVGGVVVALD